MLIWKHDEESETLPLFHRADMIVKEWISSVNSINLSNMETHVIVGFFCGTLLIYNIEQKTVICQTKYAYQIPFIDCFYSNTVADVHYFCSAWNGAKYFTVHTYSSSKKEFKEILKYESDSEIYRVRSVMIKNKRCVVYGGETSQEFTTSTTMQKLLV